MYNTGKGITYKEAQSLGLLKRYEVKEVEETYRGAGFYIIQFNDTGVKIGVAKNLCERLKVYRQPWVKPIVKLRVFSTGNAAAIELNIKRAFVTAGRGKGKTQGSTEYFYDDVYHEILCYINNKWYLDPYAISVTTR